MKIAVFGTGMVGKAIGDKLVALGHDVMMGSRTADNTNAAQWAAAAGARGSHGTYADAAAFGELVFLCTNGQGALDAIGAAGEDRLAGKVLLDITNPLDFSKGMPPTLFVFNDDSLGERVQRALPRTKVVKTLNTVNCNLMVNPGILPEPTDMFMCGDDVDAKSQARQVLTEWFGWRQVHDFGPIQNARGLESYLPFWIRMWGAAGTPNFNVKVVIGG